MKKLLLPLGCSCIVVFGIFLFLVIEEIKYSSFNDSTYQKKINELDSTIQKKKDEIQSIIDNNPKKSELELWQNQVEKAKNY